MRCIGCKKGTKRHGVPFTVCESCSRIIENYLSAKESLTKTFRDRAGIMERRFRVSKGKRKTPERIDTAYYLTAMSSRLADIEEQIAWIRNIMSNIGVLTDTEADG
jgi:hypothetical protein